MATANAAGHIALWDLEENSLLHILRGAHDAAITHIEWIPGHPILVSSGEDNSIKVRLVLQLQTYVSSHASNGLWIRPVHLHVCSSSAQDTQWRRPSCDSMA